MLEREIREEAEERVKELKSKQRIGSCESEKEYEYDCGYCHGEADGYEDGFIDGVEYGLSIAYKWHDLIKDPTDLPKNEGYYLVCMKYNYRHTYILNYGQDEYDDEEKMDWYDDESTYDPTEVIAWCEIPTFTDMEAEK